MKVTCERAEDCWSVISGFRRMICEELRFDPDGPLGQPLEYASYIIAWDRAGIPVAMAEVFRYDQAFARYEDCSYNDATDLSAVAPLNELAHIRSMATLKDRRMTRMFGYLCFGLGHVTRALGCRFTTAGTGTDNTDVIRLHDGAGMTALGTYDAEGEPQRLSLLDTQPILDRFELLRNPSFLQLDQEKLADLRTRSGLLRSQRQRAFDAAS